ncbi:Hypothetical protein SCF082_LOCUS11133, partial [Durusdinium trenchii]
VITSSCGTCADGNLPNTTLKYRTAGETCLISWQGGQSRCDRSSQSWTYWQDVWTWLGALNPRFYPIEAQPAIRRVARRFATGPWGAGVWWGNTLQYFVVVWIGTMLLWQEGCPQLDYYAYGAPDQPWPPLGGFCEQYQAVGRWDMVMVDLLGQELVLETIHETVKKPPRSTAKRDELLEEKQVGHTAYGHAAGARVVRRAVASRLGAGHTEAPGHGSDGQTGRTFPAEMGQTESGMKGPGRPRVPREVQRVPLRVTLREVTHVPSRPLKTRVKQTISAGRRLKKIENLMDMAESMLEVKIEEARSGGPDMAE